jgi:hypothetical protein
METTGASDAEGELNSFRGPGGLLQATHIVGPPLALRKSTIEQTTTPSESTIPTAL